MKRIVLNKNSIYNTIFLLLLIVPDDLYQLFPLIEEKTPISIPYHWLNYRFGLVDLGIVVSGLFILYKPTINLRLAIIICYAFFRELFFYLFSNASFIISREFSIYIVLIEGLIMTFLIYRNNAKYISLEKFYELFIVSNLLTVFYQLLSGSNGISGRYNASNLDVSATGMLACISIIYYYCSIEKRYRWVVIPILTIILFLTGSRIAVIMTLFMLSLITLYRIFGNIRTKGGVIHKNGLILIIVLINLALFVLLVRWDSISSMVKSSRINVIFSKSAILNDDSTTGRIASMIAGLNVLKNNPFGISGFFTNLQLHVMQYNYPTFPHSLLITGCLLFGPVFAIIYLYGLRLLINCFKKRSKWAWIILYLLIENVIAGGPVLNYKLYVITCIPILLAKRHLDETNI